MSRVFMSKVWIVVGLLVTSTLVWALFHVYEALR